MKSGVIYIKKRHTDSRGYCTWSIVKEKIYNSVAQRKQLIKSQAVKYSVNDINIVISVIPRF